MRKFKGPTRFCDCSKRCGQPPKEISLSAYNRHAQYRALDKLSPEFKAFLASKTQLKRPNQGLPNRKSNLPRGKVGTAQGKGKESAADLDDSDLDLGGGLDAPDQAQASDEEMVSAHNIDFSVINNPNSCMAYTGPWKDLEDCPICGEQRYKPVLGARGKCVAKQRFYTLPIGPQLQALWRSPQGGRAMKYRQNRTREILQEIETNDGNLKVFDDIFSGSDYISAVQDGDITPDDMVLLFSLDGAQLYQNKASDTWISIWIVADHAPDARYKKKMISPAFFVPGPNKMKNSDSFMFPTFHHLAALQSEGLQIWDADTNRQFRSNPFLFLGCADALCMAMMSGLVGHHGKHGCRIYCPLVGRHKVGHPHYYPARRRPLDVALDHDNHPDIPITAITGCSLRRYQENLTLIQNSQNKTQFENRRLLTGICRPTLFSGIPQSLPVPRCFSLDIMHLVALNIPDLFIKLWRGTLECGEGDDKRTWDWAVLTGVVWKNHGEAVANMTPYLPGSFDRPPRNPAKKINSGYKAWEFLLYFFGLCPAMLFGILPEKYWKNFCKLALGIRIICQRRITVDAMKKAHKALLEFADEYELLYYQQKHSRIHFVRPAIHTLCHLATEATRVGPGAYSSQWTLERTIGNLGQEVKQPSNPFTNLSERGVRRSQVNALKAMLPELDEDDKLPRGSIDLGNSYVLLRAMERSAKFVEHAEAAAIKSYIRGLGIQEQEHAGDYRVTRWARLRLPNGQIARSAWKEKCKPLERLRTARMVKCGPELRPEFGEVLYYFRLQIENVTHTLAVISPFGPPNQNLLKASLRTVYSCKLQDTVVVVDVKKLRSVVAMLPHDVDGDKHFFLMEKPGLDVADLGGFVEDDDSEDDDE